MQTEPAPTENATGLPLAPPVAATVKVPRNSAAGGAGVVNVMVWLARVAFTVFVTVGAAV